MLLQSFRMAVDAILSNKMRSFLTMLGIIIGVIALVVLVSMVTSASDSIAGEVNAMGADTLQVSIGPEATRPFTVSEVLRLQAENPEIGYTAAIAQSFGTVDDESAVTIMGVTPAYFQIQKLMLAAGRLLKTSDVENATYVAVVSYEAAQEIFHTQDIVGRRIRLHGSVFTVVGVLEESKSMFAAFVGGTIYIPYTTCARFTGSSEAVTQFVAAPAQDVPVEAAEAALDRLLSERYGSSEPEYYSVLSTSIISDALSSITGTLSLVLGGIAAVSLLVGGIGIMNIMLVSVTERTHEIGIRKAVGATTRDILVQFLIEALVLSLAGCLIGVLCSWGIISLAAWYAASAGVQMTFKMSGSVVGAAIAFSCLIGVVFGIYPARKAALMRPIEALRYVN